MDNKTYKILEIVKAKISAYNQFKKAYDKKLAFDFNSLNFFNVKENKITEILSYFINPNEKHGQGDVFLKVFKEVLLPNESLSEIIYINKEEIINANRRIDLFVEFDNKIVAIENKIWAEDQANQLADYSKYLLSLYKDFVLFYLTPYGKQPSNKSIKKDFVQELNGRLRVISYGDEILDMINRWIGVCEAENVSSFLKEFRKHIQTEILHYNLPGMKIEKNILYEYKNEVKALLDSYNEVKQEVINKHKRVSHSLKENFDENYKKDSSLNLDVFFEGVFSHEKMKVTKYGISKEKDKIWIQLVQNEIDLLISHYFEETSTTKFVQNPKFREIAFKKILDYNLSEDEIVKLFDDEVKKVIKIMKED